MSGLLHKTVQLVNKRVRRRKARPLLTFVIDSREQMPFDFTPPKRREFDDGGTMIDGLSEGDYSVCLDG